MYRNTNRGILLRRRVVVYVLHEASDPELDFTGKVCSSLHHHHQPMAHLFYDCVCLMLLYTLGSE